ncbi:MAG: endonuclease/exonuclease/phosphatase family protein, partial [Bifidobacteriaceae bacterium]|nr:endonuclease/exonuclease/phosphatase family protein [Bifidobacteriaceae bacterium]
VAPVRAAKPAKIRIIRNAAGALSVAWKAAAGAKEHRVSVAKDRNMKRIVRQASTRGSRANLSSSKFKTGQTYYVQVRAVDAGASRPVKVKIASRSPAKVRLKTNTYGKFELSWRKVAGAKGYQVKVYADPDLKRRLYTSAISPRLTRWVYGAKIKEGAKYYCQVTAYMPKKGAPAGRAAGGNSAVKAVRPKVRPVWRPNDVVATALGPASLKVAWTVANKATGYTVRLSATPEGKAAYKSKRLGASARSLVIGDLDPGKLGLAREFFVTVTADRLQTTTKDSMTVVAGLPYPEPAGKPAFSARIGSYNVKQPGQDKLGRPWDERVGQLGAKLADRDVVGVQEVTAARYNNIPRAQALAAAAGLALATTPGDNATLCSKHSIHILYRSSKFALLECGTESIDAAYERWLTWAVLEDRTSQSRVFVANTHLRSRGTDAETTRIAEANQVTRLIAARNRDNHPVILTGDLNSAEANEERTAAMTLVRAGYLSAEVTAPSRSHFVHSTFHGFEDAARNSKHIDHIMTSRGIVVHTWANLWADPAKEPSDHFPIAATVSVYR